MSKSSSLQRFNQVLMAFMLVFGLMYFGATFLIPIAIGGLFAMLLLPVSRKLESWGLPRFMAAILCVLAVIIILNAIIFLFIDQLTTLANDLPAISETLTGRINEARNFIAAKFNFSQAKQHAYLKNELKDYLSSLSSYISNILKVTGTIIGNFILTMVYACFFLIYRRKFRNFIYMLAASRLHDSPHQIVGAPARSPGVVINKITEVANSYVSGLFLVILILSAANTAGIYLIGIEHAIFFGLMAGLLNLIPYIGSIFGALIPVIYAVVTKDSLWYPAALIIFFILLQMVESYVLTPNITGARIKLNPMITIMGLLLGGFIWGIPGMIIFIPYLGIVKVIFDHVKKLRPFGYLMGKDPELDVTG